MRSHMVRGPTALNKGLSAATRSESRGEVPCLSPAIAAVEAEVIEMEGGA